MCKDNCNCGCNKCHTKKQDKCCKPCDPCHGQPCLKYCANDILCLDIKRGDDLHKVIKKLGDAICELRNQAPIQSTFVRITTTSSPDCSEIIVFQTVETETDNVLEEYSFCMPSN